MLPSVNRFLRRIAVFRDRVDVRGFQEVMLSLNIAYAVGYGLFSYVSRSQMSWVPRSDLGYYLRCSAVRVDDLLGITSKAAVSTSAVGRADFPVQRIGLELAFVASIVSVAFLLFLLSRLCRGTFAYRFITERVACGSALFLPPASYLVISALTWKWPRFPEEDPVIPFWRNELLAIFVIEILLFSILVALRRRPLPAWLVICLLIPHYVFWTFWLWPDSAVYIYQLTTPHIFLAVPPLAVIAWLLYVKNRPEQIAAKDGLVASTWTLAAAIVAIVLLFALWLPARRYSLAACQDMNSLTIEMSRGPCRGWCPQYSITIYGNGTVEYEGREFIKIKGHQVSKISKEHLLRVLQTLDDANFGSLEDRAFDWCFDSSSVAVWASAEGRTKRVASDGGCVGAKSGPQERFVQATREIDVAVASDQWVLCDGHPCRR
jgi:hypothetical protein